jgi:hypothetical protein
VIVLGENRRLGTNPLIIKSIVQRLNALTVGNNAISTLGFYWLHFYFMEVTSFKDCIILICNNSKIKYLWIHRVGYNLFQKKVFVNNRLWYNFDRYVNKNSKIKRLDSWICRVNFKKLVHLRAEPLYYWNYFEENRIEQFVRFGKKYPSLRLLQLLWYHRTSRGLF